MDNAKPNNNEKNDCKMNFQKYPLNSNKNGLILTDNNGIRRIYTKQDNQNINSKFY